jgi:peptidoglycan/xylan/chitin deacetylase (PgdA/CDA1 family)
MRRQDILVTLLHCLGFSVLRGWLMRSSREPVTRFITFHDIPDDARAFEANLAFLQRRTHVVSLDDFLRGRLSIRRINIVITFDDGYHSWVTRALPALQRLGLPAAFFVSSGFVDLSPADQAVYLRSNLGLPAREARGARGLSEGDLRALADAGHTIGGHTVSHIDLGACGDAEVIEREVLEDKQHLEQVIGRRIDYFAYPSGSYCNPCHPLPAIVAAAGYKAALTTRPGFNRRETDRYLLHRELTNARMPGLVFRARVYGNADTARRVREHMMRPLAGWRAGTGAHKAA